jgi:hypothetical protein
MQGVAFDKRQAGEGSVLICFGACVPLLRRAAAQAAPTGF